MESFSRRLVPLLVTLLVLGLLGLFVWRILSVYSRVSRGEVAPAITFGFQDALTTSPRLAQLESNSGEVETVDVATDDDPSIGPKEAKLTIVEFADFGCPYSRQASFAIRALALIYSDRIHYVYRDFPLTELHPDAQVAAEAGECARQDGEEKFWAFHDMLYQHQDDLSRESLREYARSVGVNMTRFDRCLASGQYRSEVLQDLQDGLDAGVIGTPTFFFNGQKIAGAIPLDTLRAIVDAYLR